MQAAETLPPERPGGQPAPGAVTSPEIYGNRPEKGEKGGHPSGYMPGMAGPPVARDATVYPVGIGRRRTGTGPRHEGRRSTPISGHGFPSATPQIRFPPGSTPGTADPLISPRTAPAPGWGGGGAPQARAGWGCRREGYGEPAGEGAGKGCWREARWLECGRQGRGNEFPLPVSPSPNGDIPTVQCTGISRKRAGYGFPLAPSRARLLP